MKKTDNSGSLDFSYSRMSLYNECPQKYKFRYIHKIPEKPKTYFAFGHSVHSALEFLYNVDSPPFPSLQEMLKVFEEDWKSTSPENKGYTSRDKAEKDFQQGLAMLSAYYKKHAASLHVPLAVEYKTTLPIDGLNVMVIVDRIDYLEGGKIGIVDYKTGKTVQREPDQLHMYQKILENAPDLKALILRKKNAASQNIEVENLSFYHVTTLKESVFKRATDEEMGKFWNKVLVTAENVRSRKFDPAPEERKCSFCDYKEICPVFSCEGTVIKPAAAPKPAKAPEAPAEEDVLSRKVDRYGQLLEESAGLSAEMESLKNEIAALMAEKGFVRHFGKKYEVAVSKLLRWEFADKDGLIKLLKELGLFKKTLAPIQSRVEKLLTDGNIPPHERAQLEAFARKREYPSINCKKIND